MLLVNEIVGILLVEVELTVHLLAARVVTLLLGCLVALGRDEVMDQVGAEKTKNHMAFHSKAFDLDLYDIANVKVHSELLDRDFIKHYARDSNIQTTVDSKVLIVFYQSLNDVSILKLIHLLDVAIDKSILIAVKGIAHNLLVDCDFFLLMMTMLEERVDEFQISILFLHFLVNKREGNDVLGCILNHVRGEGSSLPEHIIVLHDGLYFLLLGMDNINIDLKKVVERYVVVFVIN